MQNNFVLNYFVSHIRSCINCLGKLSKSPFNTFVTCTIVGVAFSLPTGLILINDTMQKAFPFWQNSNQVSVFFSQSAQKEDILKTNPINQQLTTKLLTPQDALNEFLNATQQNDNLRHLDNNPLPYVLIINISPNISKNSFDKLIHDLKAWSIVEEVHFDRVWLEKLNSIIEIVTICFSIAAILFAFAVIMIIANTIRLNIDKQQNNIVVAKLIGASNSFIRREFLYLGFWYGLGGAIAAYTVISICFINLQASVEKLTNLYGITLSLPFLSIKQFLMLVCYCTFLGIFSSWFAVNEHIRKIQPKHF